MQTQSKTQISLVLMLGLMIIGQLGFVLYNGSHPSLLPERASEKKIAQSGSAKAFGLTIPHEKHFQVSSVKELKHVFRQWDYDLSKVKSEGKVPHLYLAKLPRDMKKQKKASNPTFIQVLLPHILKVNEQILKDRKSLLAMQERQKQGKHLTYSEKMWLQKLASEYRCKSTKISSLLVHVDIIPPSLALAQGMLETGGGRSYAALNKNSPFGYMATKTKVQAFESLYHSVKAYMTNLNRHKAYGSFRLARAALRKGNNNPCGHKLAVHLTKYSERGEAYTKDLQGLIKKLKLGEYDPLVLDNKERLKP